MKAPDFGPPRHAEGGRARLSDDLVPNHVRQRVGVRRRRALDSRDDACFPAKGEMWRTDTSCRGTPLIVISVYNKQGKRREREREN